MPTLSNHQSTTATKLLLIGDSGAGKTGALVSLVEAGYKLRIVDFDNGLDYLANLIREQCPEKLDNVAFTTCTDKFKSVNGKLIVDGQPKAFSKAMNMMTNWKEEGLELGPVSSWGPDTVFVLDSMTFMGKAALRHILGLNGRLNAQPWMSDWGEAMGLLENCLAMLYSDEVKCNVIVTSHITTFEDEDGHTIGMYPSALGKKLPPTVSRYFNAVLLAKARGAGASQKRIIKTVTEGLLACKAASPKVPAELPLATGLAEYFKIVRGE